MDLNNEHITILNTLFVYNHTVQGERRYAEFDLQINKIMLMFNYLKYLLKRQ